MISNPTPKPPSHHFPKAKMNRANYKRILQKHLSKQETSPLNRIMALNDEENKKCLKTKKTKGRIVAKPKSETELRICLKTAVNKQHSSNSKKTNLPGRMG